jgi:hypothetical protein
MGRAKRNPSCFREEDARWVSLRSTHPTSACPRPALLPHTLSLRAQRLLRRSLWRRRKQSRVVPRRDSGLLRRFAPRNDDAETTDDYPSPSSQRYCKPILAKDAHRREILRKPAPQQSCECFARDQAAQPSLIPGSPRARDRDAPRSSGGRGCARNWCRATRFPRGRRERGTGGT